MQNIDGGRLLQLIAAVAATFFFAACGDRNDSPSGNTTTTSIPPAAATSPSNTAAPPAAGVATDSTVSTPTASPGVTLAAADREFFTLAASSDMLETSTGRLALDRSKNANVLKFAQKMVDDHGKSDENLRQVASSVGMALPTAMSPPHAEHLQRLRELKGAQFDREYAAQIGVAGHQEAIGLFERASREAANPDVRTFADKGIAGKRAHLELGQALADNVGVSADRLRMANAPPDLSSLSAAILGGANTTTTTGSGATSGTNVSKSGVTTDPAPDAAETGRSGSPATK